MKHYAVAFKVNTRITLADFEHIWRSLNALGVTLNLGSWEIHQDQAFIEGMFSGTEKGLGRIRKLCMRTGGLELDCDTM